MNDTTTKPDWAMSAREKQRMTRAEQARPSRRRWSWLAVVAVALAAGVFLVSQRWQPEASPLPLPDAALDGNVRQLLTDEVIEVAPRTLQRSVRITGETAPRRQAEVASEIGGRVESIAVQPGDAVSAGDVLAQIDVESFRIQFEQQRSTAEATRAQLDFAQSQLERTATLTEQGLAAASGLAEAQATVNQLRANLAALEAQVASAQRTLNNATIRAPISGIVATQSVEAGEYVAVGTSLVSIVDLSTLEVRAFGPVSAGPRIRPGQSVRLSIEGLPHQGLEGHVDRISPVAAEGTRSLLVFVALDNPDGLLRGGMFATGEIVVQEAAGALAVPAAALREDAEGMHVLKIEGDRVVRQAVVTGERWNDGQLVEITAGLTPGDRVVAAALPQLRAGDRIEMVDV